MWLISQASIPYGIFVDPKNNHLNIFKRWPHKLGFIELSPQSLAILSVKNGITMAGGRQCAQMAILIFQYLPILKMKMCPIA